jgi:D-glycero-D-manno-heptose 1,7-bisphosphate phosphatase
MRAAIFIEPAGLLADIDPTRGGFGRLFELRPEASAPLAALKRAGFLLIADANEHGLLHAGVGRGELDQMHEALRCAFSLDDILVCRHDDGDACPCRKPRPGLVTEAAFKWHLDLERSFVVGNRWQDAEMARMAGCVSLLVKSPWIGRGHHDFVLPDLASVAWKILDLKDGAHAVPRGTTLSHDPAGADQNLTPIEDLT